MPHTRMLVSLLSATKSRCLVEGERELYHRCFCSSARPVVANILFLVYKLPRNLVGLFLFFLNSLHRSRIF